MEFEWDENKRRSNLAKHGYDFVDAPPLFNGLYNLRRLPSGKYGEDRFATLAELNGDIIFIIHTRRNGKIRIISMRKASKHERANYNL